MNNIHDNGENDKSLNEGLEKLGRAYRQLEQDEPPELLDQAILNSAHRAVEKQPHWMNFGWLHGLTTAAVFVLAFSIILNQPETTPVLENGMRNNEPARYQRQNATKKESIGQPAEFRLEMKVKSDDQRDMIQHIPATAPERAAIESAPKDQAKPAESEMLPSLHVMEKLQGKSQREDKDEVISGLLQQEVLLDESDAVVDSSQAGIISKQTHTAVVTDPTEGDLKTRTGTNTEAEQRLLAIIKLKQSGNVMWITELESFKESYPDYPLPDELTL